MTRSALISALAGLLLATSPATAQELFPSDAYGDYQPDVKNGEVIFAAAGCATCHGIDGDNMILAGGMKIETKFGDLYAPNITHHDKNGIGKWSNATFLNAMVHGIAPDGHQYFGAVFPYPSYARMKPEDLLDLKAYLATLPVSDAPSKPHDVNVLNKVVLDLWSEPRPELSPKSNAQLARGQYLVEAVGHCGECHTPRDTGFGLRYKLDETRAYQGETGLMGDYAPNITGERLKRFGPEAFITGALAEAKKLNGSPMVSSAMRRIARMTARLPVEDRAAMYAYLTNEPFDVAQLQTVSAAASTEREPRFARRERPVSQPVAVKVDTTPKEYLGEPPEDEMQIVEVEDRTGAHGLMSLVDQYCEAQLYPDPVPLDAEPEPAPAPAAAAAPAAPRQVDPQIVAAADEVIETHCRSCHGPGKSYQGAFFTGDINDMAFEPDVVKPGDPEGSPLYASIASNRMPTGKKLTPTEVQALVAWINALGEAQNAPAEAATVTAEAAPTPTPQRPPAPPPIPVDLPDYAGGTQAERYTAVMADISALDERDRPYARYFTFAFMPLSEPDCERTGAGRNPVHYFHAGLNKFINSVSRERRLAAVEPVDGTDGAVVRIDIRDYGWSLDDWAALTRGVHTPGAEEAGFSREAWEDVAEIYPYAIDPHSDPLLKVIAAATGDPVPIMRADWFTHFGSKQPYYDMLLRLPPQIGILEAFLGIDVAQEIYDLRVVRAGMAPGSSGVSDHNRMLERFDLPRGGYYWKSYDFADDDGLQSLELYPDGPNDIGPLRTGLEPFEHDGGEMIFSLPNGLQGYYLSLANGDRLAVGPASIVSFRQKQIGKGVEIENARSCFDCHANGIIAKRDQIRDKIIASNRFDRDQLDLLMQMYVPNDELAEVYRDDQRTFIRALDRLGATQRSATGDMVSLQAPDSVGGGEIFTYLADMYFDSLDMEGLAREFGLDPETLRERTRTIGDPLIFQTVLDWISRLDAGGSVRRAEVEVYFPDVLERLTDLRGLRYIEKHVAEYVPPKLDEGEKYEEQVAVAYEEKVEKEAAPWKPAAVGEPAYVPPPKPADKLELAISVPKVEVHVDDLLVFDVSANKRCELQIFYIEESTNIEELPQQILGPRFLEAGEVRRIPYEGSGLQIRFDEPGEGETMLAFCRTGGLGEKRMTAQGALDWAKSRFQPMSRGIIIEAASRVSEDAGQSAVNAVTFTVRP